MSAGLVVVHGQRPEALLALLIRWQRQDPLAPLEPEVVLVQSGGIGQWLRRALAAPIADGGLGIAASLQLELPAQFLWRAYRAVLGPQALPARSPFDKERLSWRVLRLLPGLLAQPAFAPLAQYLADDADGRRRQQLGLRLADLFDQYQVYRADWLSDWADGRDALRDRHGQPRPLPPTQAWQPLLWRALLADVGSAEAPGRSAIHTRFLAALARAPAAGAAARPPGLPRRIACFGVSSLPEQTLEALTALARHAQVLLFVHNPSQYYWADLVPEHDWLREAARRQPLRAGRPPALPDAALRQHGHPLLAAWGRQGRDYIGLIDTLCDAPAAAGAPPAQRIELFEPAPTDSLLRQWQDDVLQLRPLAETRSLWPAVDPAEDRSIRFHIAHGPLREVEILHDELLAALAADPTLTPRDILVMVPDIDAYAAPIRAVFGQHGSDDPRRIPFTLADRGQRHEDPLLLALDRLLRLPQLRLGASEVLDLLDVPAVRRRHGVDAADLPLLRRWIAAANIRWGLDDRHRAGLGFPDQPPTHSWAFGLRRMLLGHAVGRGPAWAGIEPMDEIGGLDAARLGPLIALTDALAATLAALADEATPEQWVARLNALLLRHFAADDTDPDAWTLNRLREGLARWLDDCTAAGYDAPLPLTVVREHWLGRLDAGGLNQPFFAGSTIFATLMPMRAIPFRHVCLLGLHDGAFPRQRPASDFDLMHGDSRPGDRSRREDDRYLFLEALLSARDRLHLSWVGRGVHDDQPRPASVLVAQLRDHLAAGWRLAGTADDDPDAGRALLAALTTEHPLQAWDRRYFEAGSPLHSAAREWQAAWQAAAPVAASAPLPAPAVLEPLTAYRLAQFLKDPAGAFLGDRLGVRFERPADPLDDDEPFALDGLDRWQIDERLIADIGRALDEQRDPQAALNARLARIAAAGSLPAGPFTAVQREQSRVRMTALIERWQQVHADYPVPLPPVALRRVDTIDGRALIVSDRLGGLRGKADGTRLRLLPAATRLLEGQRYRRDKLLAAWVEHLALTLAIGPLETRLLGPSGHATLQPLDAAAAAGHWQALLAAWLAGQCAPLALAPQTGFAWLKSGGRSDDPAQRAKAEHAARAAYDGGNARQRAERDTLRALRRAFPDYGALRADPQFEHWISTLLAPLDDACGAAEPKSGSKRGADEAES